MPSENSDSKRTMTQLSIVVGVAILLAAAIVTAVVVANQPKNTAKTYQQCVDAGGVIMETHPEQCRVGDKTFANEAQVPDAADGVYVGLSEQDALDAAKKAGNAARVVQRDDEPLAVTMDFSPGRLNLYVENDKVVRVQVEGED